MDFDALLEQILELIQRQGRVSYRAIKRRFDVEDDYLEDLKEEILFAHPHIVDEESRGLVWTGDVMPPSETASPPSQTTQQPVIQVAQPTQAEVPPAEPSIPDAERRQLTVMFCDLAESTKLSGRLDPEDLRDVIRAYQATSTEVIERFDGYIAQHLGDGLMVYFGWPQAHEDDAQRAVYAGLGILEAMGGLNTRLEQEKGIRLRVRIGIHTGLVVVGEIGQGASQENLALGETPNVASRIEGLAMPDTLAISTATYQLVQGYFVCEHLGLHTLKGVDESQLVYRVLRESGAQTRLDVGVARGLTPLVGRESEVSLLLERWEQVKGGQGQVVFLSGEVGIGKSRLIQILKDHVADASYTRLECRSSPYYQNTALYPITDLLQRALRWQRADTLKQKLAKLEQMLGQYRLELEETVPLFATLLSLSVPENRYPSLTLSPQRQRQRTLETIMAMLLQQAQEQPVLFILEDLHWTDPSTLELLTLLIDQVPTASLLTLLTCRPEFEPPWGLRSHLTPIALNRFTRPQIETMVERVTDGKTLPAEVMQHLVEKTDGIPLYVEEMTKAILESGALQITNGRYELTGPLASLAIPSTLQDSLMAKLDRLGTTKGIAQIGATIGRQFSYELLQAVSQIDEAIVQREMGKLVDAELLYQRGLPPQATYVFKHALIQDTAYQSLLRRTRQQTHQRIARVLEGQFPETADAQPELLAHHFTEAGLSDQAIPYWQQAGKRALQRSAHAEAMGHLTKGLELLQTLPKTPERTQQELLLQTALSSALVAAKGQGSHEVRDAYERARKLCQQVGDTPQLFPVLRGLWMYYMQQHEAQSMYDVAGQLLTLAERQHDPSLLVEAQGALGKTQYWCGEFIGAREQLERGLALYDHQQHRTLGTVYGQDPGVSCLSYLSWALWYLGYPDQALQQSQEALNLAHELSHPPTLGWALCASSWTHCYRREGQAGYELGEEAIAFATRQELPHWIAMGKGMRGRALVELGQWEAAVEQIQEGVEAYRATGAQNWSVLSLAARAYGQGGQPEEGLRLLVEVLDHVDEPTLRQYAAEIYRIKGELLLQQEIPDAPQAEDSFQQSLDVARHQQAKSLELRAAMSLARLWQSQDKRQDAYELLAPVYGWFTEGFDTADLQEAKLLLEELSS